jgi:pimeloyl-ACP methyl ester carboxylesterase
MAHVARFERHGASPAAAYAIIRMAAAIEVRGLCPAVHAPSLVMHRRDDVLVPPANSRYLAEHLPEARYVELDGVDHPLWLGENERFLTRWTASSAPTTHHYLARPRSWRPC